jgi:hypothetical protein
MAYNRSKPKQLRTLVPYGRSILSYPYQVTANNMATLLSAIPPAIDWNLNSKLYPELIQARGEILCSKIHNLINSIWNKEKLPDQWKESIIVPVPKKGDKTDCSNYWGILLLSTYFVQYTSLKVKSIIINHGSMKDTQNY